MGPPSSDLSASFLASIARPGLHHSLLIAAPSEAVMVSSEVKLISAAAGLYSSFLYWGFLQEKITGADYVSPLDASVTGRWHFSFVLNACMALAAILAASVLLFLTGETNGNPSVKHFWRPALSCTLASPFGYWSLSFINYPLLLLAKSCKLVPVMLVGVVMLGRRHTRAEYLAVGLITAGVALFSFKPAALEDAELTKEDGGHAGSGGSNLIGLALVSVNLILDGVTNAEQDRINARFKAPGSYMMLAINFWILTFHLAYLSASWAIYGPDSELAQALQFMATFPEVVKNVAAFCACAGTGQLFVFFIIKEFGSLVNVTVTISRKFFSVLISVYIYGHHIAWYQWIGVFSVYGGLALNVWTRYNNDGERRKIRADELKLDTLTEASAISLRPAGKRSPGQRGWGQPFRGGEGGVGASAASLAAPQNDKEEEALLLGDTPVVVGKNGRMTR
ncbi:unnamed protein product [Pylaiella littoralis]